jgi:hypothetical protein
MGQDVLHFLTRAWWQKTLPAIQNVIKTSLVKKYWEEEYQMGVEQLSRTQGLAKHVEKQREWKLPHVSESEGLAVLGSYSVAQGALHGILAGLGGGHGVEACEGNVRGYVQEGPALEQVQHWDVGGAEGQLLLLGKVLVAVVGARKGASRNKIPSMTRVSTGLPVQEVALQGLSWVDNMKEVQGFKRDKTVEVAKQQCKEMVVGIYIYKEDQGHEVNYMKDVFKSILREAFSSLNFSLGDVAHAALCSRVLSC